MFRRLSSWSSGFINSTEQLPGGVIISRRNLHADISVSVEVPPNGLLKHSSGRNASIPAARSLATTRSAATSVPHVTSVTKSCCFSAAESGAKKYFGRFGSGGGGGGGGALGVSNGVWSIAHATASSGYSAPQYEHFFIGLAVRPASPARLKSPALLRRGRGCAGRRLCCGRGWRAGRCRRWIRSGCPTR